MFRKSKVDVFKWLALLPALAELVGKVVQSFRDDKRIDEQELKDIGADLVAIVAAVL